MEITQPGTIERRARYSAIAGWAILALAYTAIFRAFSESELLPAALRALINVAPAVLLTFPVLHVVETYIIDRSAAVQSVSNLLLAILFSILWYVGVQAGYGLREGWLTEGLAGRPLQGVALTWQLFQGITLYVVVALYGYARTYRRRLAAAETKLALRTRDVPAVPAPVQVPTTRTQILVKDGKLLKPVAIAEIFALSGAGDYSEVFTRTGNYLAGTTLSEFEALLPGDQFARVHRSHIVRIDAIVSIEPAGNGRLSLHLPSGVSIVTSRTGARVVREHAV